MDVETLPHDYKTFLNKTILFFGQSNSGKTVLVDHIMYCLKDTVPNAVIFSLTEGVNGLFSRRVDECFIHTEITEEKLKYIFERQEMATIIYNKCNDIRKLKNLFSKIGSKETQMYELEINKKMNKSLDDIREDKKLTKNDKIKLEGSIKEKNKAMLTKFYKNSIKKNKNKILLTKLDDDDIFVLKYLDFNPNLLLVMDDCAVAIKKWGKDETIKKIFYQGRYYHITSLYTFQDDKSLTAELRQNAFLTFFTTKQCAVTYFGRLSNGFDKRTKQTAELIANKIFEQKDDNYKKMVYARVGMPSEFYFIEAELHNDYKFGSNYFVKLSGELKEKEVKKPNKFYNSFLN